MPVKTAFSNSSNCRVTCFIEKRTRKYYLREKLFATHAMLRLSNPLIWLLIKSDVFSRSFQISWELSIAF